MIVSFSSPFSLPFHSLRKSVGSWALLRIPEKGRVFRSHCLLVFTFLVTRAFCQKQNCCTTKCPRESPAARRRQKASKEAAPAQVPSSGGQREGLPKRRRRRSAGRPSASQGSSVSAKASKEAVQRRASKCLPRRRRLGKGLLKGGVCSAGRPSAFQGGSVSAKASKRRCLAAKASEEAAPGSAGAAQGLPKARRRSSRCADSTG